MNLSAALARLLSGFWSLCHSATNNPEVLSSTDQTAGLKNTVFCPRPLFKGRHFYPRALFKQRQADGDFLLPHLSVNCRHSGGGIVRSLSRIIVRHCCQGLVHRWPDNRSQTQQTLIQMFCAQTQIEMQIYCRPFQTS